MSSFIDRHHIEAEPVSILSGHDDQETCNAIHAPCYFDWQCEVLLGFSESAIWYLA